MFPIKLFLCFLSCWLPIPIRNSRVELAEANSQQQKRKFLSSFSLSMIDCRDEDPKADRFYSCGITQKGAVLLTWANDQVFQTSPSNRNKDSKVFANFAQSPLLIPRKWDVFPGGKWTVGEYWRDQTRREVKPPRGQGQKLQSQADRLPYCLIHVDSLRWSLDIGAHTSPFHSPAEVVFATQTDCSSWACYSTSPFLGRTAFEAIPVGSGSLSVVYVVHHDGNLSASD